MKYLFNFVMPDYANWDKNVSDTPDSTLSKIVVDIKDIARWYSASDYVEDKLIKGTAIVLHDGTTILLAISFTLFCTLYCNATHVTIADYTAKNN